MGPKKEFDIKPRLGMPEILPNESTSIFPDSSIFPRRSPVIAPLSHAKPTNCRVLSQSSVQGIQKSRAFVSVNDALSFNKASKSVLELVKGKLIRKTQKKINDP
ncbi:hypothetical protein Adt_25565 [Abeliophyllum distichum]|uniref:Uncharacterized protein n=1 Tax=Abeliophyllum distichum TaxID=126358 RepID=A0ABD1SH35_9LAMI